MARAMKKLILLISLFTLFSIQVQSARLPIVPLRKIFRLASPHSIRHIFGREKGQIVRLSRKEQQRLYDDATKKYGEEIRRVVNGGTEQKLKLALQL